ncbi:MAG: phosphoenolpyruvate--protein phosphotransferase [Clostridiales bacterium]|nr:phosphoenolpyruvate--protein phosphotransferase [Clostridiales bacterium]MDY4111651.1 phosphoenolpyruvate--protein phosphotransferase [Roseburia sp.]
MVLEGKSVFGGIAIGRLSVYHKKDNQVKRMKVTDTDAETARFMTAKEQAKEQLATFYEKALKEIGEVNAMIFEVHQMMLDDPDYIESITNMIATQEVNAEFAVATTGDNFSQMFAAMDDDYMRERAADVKDISNRVISILQGATHGGMTGDEPVILLADDLAPSETVQLDKSKVLSFVTRHGSTNSHTAILARTMNIPALIGVDFPEVAEPAGSAAVGDSQPVTLDGAFGIVDGYTGRLYVNPDEATLASYQAKKEEDEQKKRLLQELKGKENITLDGRKINIYANIGGVADVANALANDAGGIGLFRSEFLYLESEDYPTEEAQFSAYKAVAENMAGKKVIIRTLDIGADKQVGYFGLEKEENPAMGYRAIRICLDRKDIFKTQLRAIYRASYYGTISIMFPMIISVSEVKQIKQIIAEVKAELTEAGIPYKDCEIGVMIETPAAVMISDLLAKEVDFFSIGTNDLTQYTLAIDRQNPKLDSIYDAHHEAVLRMLQMVVDNGHKEGCWVGICGELGADLTLTEQFLRMGFDELSVSPSMILKVRDKVRNADLSK